MEFGSEYIYVEPGDSGFVAGVGGASVSPQTPVVKRGVAGPGPLALHSFLTESPIPSLDPEEPKPKLLLPAVETDTQSPISQSALSAKDRVLSVKNLVNATRDVINCEQLGIQLDLKPAQLQRIKNDHPNNCDNFKSNMFDVWLKDDVDASWSKLAKAFQHMSGNFVLSQTILRDYVEDPSKPSKEPKRVQFSPSVHEHDGPSAATGVGVTDSRQPSDRGYRIDSNVMAIKFSVLADPKELHTGDAVVCSNRKCTAILNSISTVNSESIWECEFCQNKNKVDVVNEEIPLKEDTLYMLEPSDSVRACGRNLMEGQTAPAKDAIVVFCIDISGSMGCTTEVSGRFKLKGHERIEALFRQHSQGHRQFLPRESRDVTYVSRLQGVQGAIEQQLSILSNSSPSQKVALVTFNDEVIVCLDGREDTVITGDKLSNYSSLEKIGKGLTLPIALRNTKQQFIDKVTSLEESGQTALGPALLTSILLAGKVPGSKVIVCTDGLANIGIGRLDSEELTSPEKLAAAQKFYSELGILARDKSVTVSILTTKGCESRLLELGRVADITAGRVNIVDPLKVKEEFVNILANPVLATQVVSKIVLHSDIRFRSTFIETDDESMLTIPVGNATKTTELNYEFEIRDKAKPSKKDFATSKFVSTVTIGGEEFIPFQLQIEYTGTDKSRYQRVITKTMPVTSDRSRADRGIQSDVWARTNMRSNAFKNRIKFYKGSSEHSTAIIQECGRIIESSSTTRRTKAAGARLRSQTLALRKATNSEIARNHCPDFETSFDVVATESGREVRVRKPEKCLRTGDADTGIVYGCIDEDFVVRSDEEFEDDITPTAKPVPLLSNGHLPTTTKKQQEEKQREESEVPKEKVVKQRIESKEEEESASVDEKNTN